MRGLLLGATPLIQALNRVNEQCGRLGRGSSRQKTDKAEALRGRIVAMSMYPAQLGIGITPFYR